MVSSNTKLAITEILLSFTVFHQDLSASVIAQFCILLFVKRFHWLASNRVGQAARVQNLTLMHHIRLSLLISLLFLIDSLTASGLCYYLLASKGFSVMLLFALEVV